MTSALTDEYAFRYPQVTLDFDKAFVDRYTGIGDAITKAEGVDFAASKAVFTEATGGTFAVMTCAMGDFANLVPVANGGALEMGKLICVKPTAAEGYDCPIGPDLIPLPQ